MTRLHKFTGLFLLATILTVCLIPDYTTLGKGKPTVRTANYSAAMGSNDRRSYLGRQRDGYRQTLLVLCGVHGMESEAVAGAVNLLHILETGKDLRARRWPAITKYAKKLRLLLVPLANPDGRARVKIPSLVGLPLDDLVYYGLDPGEYDLGDFLKRRDGSATDTLPPLPIEIRSVLPAGQIRPNKLTGGDTPDVGGYALTLWTRAPR